MHCCTNIVLICAVCPTATETLPAKAPSQNFEGLAGKGGRTSKENKEACDKKDHLEEDRKIASVLDSDSYGCSIL